MYCKFCGNRISLNTTTCMSCGANINFRDGGQTFFEDNELEAWQNDSVIYGNTTNMPKTVNLGRGLSNKFFEAGKAERAHNRMIPGKKRKALLSGLNLSHSGRLVVSGIVLVLVVVLFVAGFVALLTREKTTDDFATLTLEERIEKVNDIKLEAGDVVAFDNGMLSSEGMPSNIKFKGYKIKDTAYINFYDIIRGESGEVLLPGFIDEIYKDFETSEKKGFSLLGLKNKYVFNSIDDQKEIIINIKKKEDIITINGKEIKVNAVLIQNAEDSRAAVYIPIEDFLNKSGTDYTFRIDEEIL